MRVHHLSCGSLCPFGRRWVNGTGSLLERAELCCHCLLIESDAGLILVDTGLGTGDVLQPALRLGRWFTAVAQPRLRLEDTALHQVRGLGFAPEDVRHIILTHGDLDHAGGLSDFPHAEVHLYADEHAAITAPEGVEKLRYRPLQLAHGPKWVPHALEGDRWMGFDAVRAIPGVAPDVLIVPLVGHTRGHAAVAVRREGGWWLHAGDAYFYRGQMDPDRPHIPPGLGAFQRFADHDREARVTNQERLRNLAFDKNGELSVFCAHDPEELARAQVKT
jgi:glyoxylase-like metal-dependent hydrolase (beta-lactamase superfamily II)